MKLVTKMAIGLGLMLGPQTAQAQDLSFDIGSTLACLDEALGHAERNDCIGASAEYCMEINPAGYTTIGMSGCADLELTYWDARLNDSYQNLRRAEKADDDLGRDLPGYVNKANALRDMQRAWIGWRDATCDYERAQWGGGTGGGPATVACLMRLTGEQALYLETVRMGQ